MIGNKKRAFIMVSLVISVVLVIFLIEYLQGIQDPQDAELKCIAKDAKIYISKTCSHCAQQKEILGDGLKYFQLIDCLETPDQCQGITGVPTWEIQGERYPGVKSIEKLKEITGC